MKLWPLHRRVAAAPIVPAQIRVLASDRRMLQPTKMPWQNQARWFAKNVGLARFGAAVVSETISRMIPVAERRVGRDWVKGADQTVQDLIDAYVGYAQNQQQLVRLHAWHYQVTGESYMADLSSEVAAQFGIFLTDHVILNKDGTADIKLRPNADRKRGGLLVVPQNLLWRVWWADEDWPLLATSPLRAVLDDLHRYMALSGTVSRTAMSALLEAGIVWTPEEAHVPLPQAVQEATGFYSEIERDYYEVAGLALTPDYTRFTSMSPYAMEGAQPRGETLAMYAPAMWRWPAELGPPQHVGLRRPQDPMNISALEWCVKAYARGTNLPNQLVVEGQGQGNHWSAWLVDEKFHLTTTAPYADKVFHTDVTQFYLRPTLRVLKVTGQWQGDPERWRVGYDPAPVLVHPDRSMQAIDLYKIGLLKAESVLRENGMSIGDLPSKDELRDIVSTLQKLTGPKGQAGPGAPDRGAQTTPNRNTPATVRQDQPNPQDARFALRAALTAATTLALRQARRRAETKLQVRARSRHKEELVPAAGQALTAGLIQAVSVTEEELLDRAFLELYDLTEQLTGDQVRARSLEVRARQAALAALAEPDEQAAQDVDWVVAAALD